MAWNKLPNVGDRASITVKQLGTEKGRYGMQVHFRGTNGDDLYVPDDIAYAWLETCGFGTAENIEFDHVIGETLTFERTAAPDGGRPHWKITREAYPGARAPDGATPVPSSPPAPAGVVDSPSPGATGRPSPAGGINDHLPAPRAGAAPGLGQSKDARRADIVEAYTWALAAVTTAQLAHAKKHKAAPKPTAASIQEGVTTLMLRAERLNAI